jgi:hypothetical protein
VQTGNYSSTTSTHSLISSEQALKGVWVNIHDLIHAVRNDCTPPQRFPNQRALALYTRNHNKYYPKEKAKAGGPVRTLLAHIF